MFKNRWVQSQFFNHFSNPKPQEVTFGAMFDVRFAAVGHNPPLFLNPLGAIIRGKLTFWQNSNYNGQAGISFISGGLGLLNLILGQKRHQTIFPMGFFHLSFFQLSGVSKYFHSNSQFQTISQRKKPFKITHLFSFFF